MQVIIVSAVAHESPASMFSLDQNIPGSRCFSASSSGALSVSYAVAVRAYPCSIRPITLALHFEPIANVDDQRRFIVYAPTVTRTAEAC
jgi:hypothetical protein